MKTLNPFVESVSIICPKKQMLCSLIGLWQHILDMTAFLGEVSVGRQPSFAWPNQLSRSQTPVEPSSTLSQLDSPLPVTEPDKELLFRFVWSFQERIGSTCE